MEKIKTSEQIVELRSHSFYCDGCGAFLGESKEEADGYYEEKGLFNIRVFRYYEISKHFCDKCKKDFELKLNNLLLDLGFKENV